jgi:hypothetical protein
MLILRAITHEKAQATTGQALDQTIEHSLCPSIDPVQVLDEHQERLHLTLLEQQELDAFDDTLAALRRIEGLPLWDGRRPRPTMPALLVWFPGGLHPT